MKIFDELKNTNTVAFKGGSYSLATIAIVFLIIMVINIMFGILPNSITKKDISSTKLYSITSSTKVTVNNLSDDVTIYWIVQADEEDEVINNLLSKYEALSDHIKVEKKNPDVYPTFAENYTDEEVLNNSLVVESGSKYRYISYDEIYLSQADYSTYSYNYSFDGEGAITSAIDYVTTDELPVIYVLEGHGEKELPETFAKAIEAENILTSSFSLINEETIPSDAKCILIYAPQTDISEAEKKILASYVMDGGKLIVFSGTTENGTLNNLTSLLADYDISVVDGIVVDNDRDHYAFSQPYILFPDINEDDITKPLIDENYYILFPLAQGFNVGSLGEEYVNSLLTTSNEAYSKVAGYEATTFDWEDGDVSGPFSIAVSITSDNDGKLIWFGSSYFLEEEYNEYSSGANVNLALNGIISCIGETQATSIHSKSLGYNYLTISAIQSTLLSTIMIGIVPAVFIIIGIVIIVKRKAINHE